MQQLPCNWLQLLKGAAAIRMNPADILCCSIVAQGDEDLMLLGEFQKFLIQQGAVGGDFIVKFPREAQRFGIVNGVVDQLPLKQRLSAEKDNAVVAGIFGGQIYGCFGGIRRHSMSILTDIAVCAPEVAGIGEMQGQVHQITP